MPFFAFLKEEAVEVDGAGGRLRVSCRVRKAHMRKLVTLLTEIGVLAIANYFIEEKEQLLASGCVVFLEPIPVEPNVPSHRAERRGGWVFLEGHWR